MEVKWPRESLFVIVWNISRLFQEHLAVKITDNHLKMTSCPISPGVCRFVFKSRHCNHKDCPVAHLRTLIYNLLTLSTICLFFYTCIFTCILQYNPTIWCFPEEDTFSFQSAFSQCFFLMSSQAVFLHHCHCLACSLEVYIRIVMQTQKPK